MEICSTLTLIFILFLISSWIGFAFHKHKTIKTICQEQRENVHINHKHQIWFSIIPMSIESLQLSSLVWLQSDFLGVKNHDQYKNWIEGLTAQQSNGNQLLLFLLIISLILGILPHIIAFFLLVMKHISQWKLDLCIDDHKDISSLYPCVFLTVHYRLLTCLGDMLILPLFFLLQNIAKCLPDGSSLISNPCDSFPHIPIVVLTILFMGGNYGLLLWIKIRANLSHSRITYSNFFPLLIKILLSVALFYSPYIGLNLILIGIAVFLLLRWLFYARPYYFSLSHPIHVTTLIMVLWNIFMSFIPNQNNSHLTLILLILGYVFIIILGFIHYRDSTRFFSPSSSFSSEHEALVLHPERPKELLGGY